MPLGIRSLADMDIDYGVERVARFDCRLTSLRSSNRPTIEPSLAGCFGPRRSDKRSESDRELEGGIIRLARFDCRVRVTHPIYRCHVAAFNAP